MSNISIIIQREFNERVRKKSFIITTLLMPLLMIGLMAAPALIMQFSRGDEKVIAVIDDSGLVAPKLESDEEIRFETTALPTEEARKQLTDKFGVLYIGGDILENPNNVRLYANSSSSLSLESNITGQIERILEAEKLKAYNIENLSQILDEVKTSVNMQTFRNDITTVTVYETGVEDSVDTTGLVVRQETLLEGSGERMEVLPAEGEAVAKGEIIARIYQDQAALEQHQNLKAKQTEREALQYVLSHSTESSDTAELSKRVIASLESIRATVFHEDLSDLSDQIQSVENMIYRQDYTYKGSEAVTKEINQLSKEIKQLEKEADSTVSTIKAKQAGTFSAMVDGYETVLEPAKLSGLTPAKLDELVKARQEVKEGKYLGKIITGGKWYYAVSMDVANVERMHEGMTVTVRFDNVAGEQTMKVETIGDAKGNQKQVTVVFSSTRHLAETSLLRQQSAAVIYESYRGFRVPKEALRMEGDKYYLYRVSGAQLRKVEVEILCQLDDYYVVWQGKSVDKDGKSVQQSALEKAKQIRDGDTIVVRGMNLYDGKVVGSRAKT